MKEAVGYEKDIELMVIEASVDHDKGDNDDHLGESNEIAAKMKTKAKRKERIHNESDSIRSTEPTEQLQVNPTIADNSHPPERTGHPPHDQDHQHHPSMNARMLSLATNGKGDDAPNILVYKKVTMKESLYFSSFTQRSSLP